MLPVFVGRFHFLISAMETATRCARGSPCEKKSKGNECARWRERAPTARRYHGHGVPISTYYSGNGGAKFAKKIWVVPEMRTNWLWCGSSRVFNQGTECGCPRTTCKAQTSVFGSGTLPDLLVTISLGGSVNTREKVAALRLKTSP